MTEAEFQEQVIELAHVYGWLVAHFRPAKTERGWRTPVQADGAGFPDLVLVRDSRLIFAELKGEKGRLRPEQEMWLKALSGAATSGTALPLSPVSRHFEVHVWRPADFDEINATLRRAA